VLLLGGLCLLCACNNEVVNNNIPYAPVSFTIDTGLAGADKELGFDGNCRCYDSKHPAALSTSYGQYGYSGVVVVRAYDSKLYAFDLCCPYEAQKDIVLNSDGCYFVSCPVCGSQFEIGNGSGRVSKGPASQPLKNYKVYTSSLDQYRIGH